MPAWPWGAPAPPVGFVPPAPPLALLALPAVPLGAPAAFEASLLDELQAMGESNASRHPLKKTGAVLVCIIGSNGAGKTTLMRCLSGLLVTSAGGIAPTNQTALHARHIGLQGGN